MVRSGSTCTSGWRAAGPRTRSCGRPCGDGEALSRSRAGDHRPGDEGLALHLALHAAQDGPGDPKAIGDLARGIERWAPDTWREAAGLARRFRAFRRSPPGFGSCPPAPARKRLELPSTPSLDWEILHRQVRPRGAFHLQAIGGARGMRERAEVLRRSLCRLPSGSSTSIVGPGGAERTCSRAMPGICCGVRSGRCAPSDSSCEPDDSASGAAAVQGVLPQLQPLTHNGTRAC